MLLGGAIGTMENREVVGSWRKVGICHRRQRREGEKAIENQRMDKTLRLRPTSRD